MGKVLNEVLDAFYKKLSESDAVDGEMVKDLRTLFDADKKLKAGDFVAVLSRESKEPKK